jgi:hypothetical protein
LVETGFLFLINLTEHKMEWILSIGLGMLLHPIFLLSPFKGIELLGQNVLQTEQITI